MEFQIGIKVENRQSVAENLSKLLADEFVLYTKTRRAHWNIEGADFYAQHKFFEAQYEQLDEIIDNVAERIRMIGHYAPSTLANFLQLTHLTEQSRESNDSHGFIHELLSDHESIIMECRKNITITAEQYHDLGTSDFLTTLLETHEKMAWMLRAHL